MLSVFLIHIASLMCLPDLSDSRSITFALSQSITWFLLQHESRRGELPIEPRMGQILTYWRPLPEVSPDEDFGREVETSITKYVILVVYRVINIVFVSTWWNFSQNWTESSLKSTLNVHKYTTISMEAVPWCPKSTRKSITWKRPC